MSLTLHYLLPVSRLATAVIDLPCSRAYRGRSASLLPTLLDPTTAHRTFPSSLLGRLISCLLVWEVSVLRMRIPSKHGVDRTSCLFLLKRLVFLVVFFLFLLRLLVVWEKCYFS